MANVTHLDSTEITIRAARTEDLDAMARVAGRDTHELPQGRLLVAEVGSDVRAAISLDDGAIIADPFHRTAELVEMLKIRAGGGRQARDRHEGRKRSRRLFVTAGRAA